MAKSKTLVFTTCYNEYENIGLLIDQLSANLPDTDILVVDDNSPDGTWDVIEEKRKSYPNLYSVRRPRKLGIGSAHKYAIFYAIREGYESLVTMDADFSHDPREISSMLAVHGPNIFVTGSRYCEGGVSDYTGYRDVVSRIGNFVARRILGVKLKELTTYFRVFDVESLKRLPLRYINSSGYSYGVELVYYLKRCGVELREWPIHFSDRTHGASKIPRVQIFKSSFDLFVLGLKRLNIFRNLSPDVLVADTCPNCGDAVLAMKHFGSVKHRDLDAVNVTEAELRCTAVGSREYPPVYTCLCCSLEQVPASLMPGRLEETYQDVTDDTYIENIEARRKTFRRCFDRIEPYIGRNPGHLLEVGAYCGLFLQEAGRRGWSGQGVEPSRWAAGYATSVSKVDVYQGFLEDCARQLKPEYDVVVSWDVLEHVRNPRQFLEDCGRFLGSGGMICLSTLDVGTWAPRLLKRRWPWLMNMHLFYFDLPTLADMLDRAGYTLIHSEPYVHYARVNYMLSRGVQVLPAFAQKPALRIIAVIPDSFILPVSLGDIKLLIARKR